ncbi:hypothetical protein SKAU_G00229880 [Synaphobranchus kaupii]|uniref:Ig-like domain-containing protein n=1 Tax=Synaphobranchus kaupii TaxID=118154 RepID=A0A9Q1F5D1_SYNKA|nr:hypothetical protein SKAU_G00229880 [Synaphobranchus kaupii]
MDARYLIFVLNCLLTPGLSAKVTAKGTSTAAFGQEASFSCSLSEPDGASQVTWQRLLKDNTVENLATFSKRFGAKVMDPHVSRIHFTEASLNSTSITIKNVTPADDACYICSFNVYPSGSIRKQTCLMVQGIFEARAWIPSGETSSEKDVVVRCSVKIKTAYGRSLSGLWIVILVLAVASVVGSYIAFRLRRKRATCGDYSPNGRERLARRCSCFAVPIEGEENRTLKPQLSTVEQPAQIAMEM